jgi:hypothetical protein
MNIPCKDCLTLAICKSRTFVQRMTICRLVAEWIVSEPYNVNKHLYNCYPISLNNEDLKYVKL